MTYLQKLAEIASAPLSAARVTMPEIVRVEAGPLADGIEQLLKEKNGFLAFESALHVFPLGPRPEVMTLSNWNEADLWRDAYGDLAREGLFFAEDVFGNQFRIRDQQIWSFEAETGETRPIAKDVEGWAEAILDDYNHLTGYPLAHEWQAENGPLTLGDRLVPIRPFVLGGAYALHNLRATGAVRGMRWRGEIARQILHLPDGASITVKSLS
jgi:hypothetical protein